MKLQLPLQLSSSFLWGALLVLALNANANTDNAQRGLEIVTKVDLVDRGWGDVRADLEMILGNKQGQTSSRTLSIKTLEVKNDGDKSLSVFDEPKDVKGTAFLSFSHALEPDQQWLYLPALKRVKRISSVNKSGPFLGSEFAFEDLSSFEVEKYTYEFLREDTLSEQPVFIVKFTPKYEHSGYQHQEVWIDQERHIFLKTDYFDRKGALLKTLEFHNYKQYLNQYWRADRFVVNNHQNGKSTILNWQNYQFRTGLSDTDFNQNGLKRAR